VSTVVLRDRFELTGADRLTDVLHRGMLIEAWEGNVGALKKLDSMQRVTPRLSACTDTQS
jgi:hypothetical protein